MKLLFQVEEFGVREVRDLKPGGRNIVVTEETKKEYVHLVCQMKMTGKRRQAVSIGNDLRLCFTWFVVSI